jgi:uncharacterized membrane protein YkvA (DUF1232 family)
MRTAFRNPKNWLNGRMEEFRSGMVLALRHVHVLTLVLRHREVPWHAKATPALAVLYVLSPIQLIPSFIPVIGQMDDLFVIWLAMKMARKFVSKKAMADCELQAKVGPAMRASESTLPCGRPLPLSFAPSE